MAFDLRKGGEDAQSKVPASMPRAVGTPDTATGAGKSKRPLWLLAIAGFVVLIAIAAWYFRQPSSEGGVGIPSGPQAGTTDATKSATQPATTPPTAASKTQVATPDQPTSSKTQVATADRPNSAAVASAKRPISGSQKPDAATGTIPVRFQPGSSSVAAPDSAVVDAILTYLSAHPTSKATVSGYASSEGDLATNAALAKERADAFKAYLVGRGVTAERIIAMGRGIERPIASNDSQQGRAKNRRVEVNF